MAKGRSYRGAAGLKATQLQLPQPPPLRGFDIALRAIWIERGPGGEATPSPEADLPTELFVLPALLAGFGDAGVVLAAELDRQPLALVATPLHYGDLLIGRRGAEL